MLSYRIHSTGVKYLCHYIVVQCGMLILAEHYDYYDFVVANSIFNVLLL